MFRLVLVFVLACAMSIQCGTILAASIGQMLFEESIKTNDSNPVPPSAPMVAVKPALNDTSVALVQQPIDDIVQPVLPKASLVAEKTIETHGHQVVHNAQPLVAKPLENVKQLQIANIAIPVITAREMVYAAPIYYSAYPQLIAENSVSSYRHNVQHVT